jgi:DNA-binding XRE family transcriptional regulator
MARPSLKDKGRMIITPSQCRGARAMLGWTQGHLATVAGVAKATVVDFERNARSPMLQNLTAIRRAIEGAGMALIGENGGGRGVRFSQPGAEETVSTEGEEGQSAD